VHANKVYIAKMGIGMVMPKVVEVFPFGHMWVYWKEEKDNFYPHCRGYYPVEEDVPSVARDSRMQILKFFARNFVRGFYRVDVRARRIMQEKIDQIFYKEWKITKEQLNALMVKCHFPDEKDYKLEGRYSWNRKQPNWNNCSSWAIKVVCKIMNNPTFLTCNSPKQLSSVKAEIDWAHVPRA